MNKDNSILELNKFLLKKKYKKILIITGKNSFFKSGAARIIGKILELKKTKFFFKKSYIPEIKELKKIVFVANKFKPDLILALGGGAVIDYSKVVSCVNLQEINFRNIFLGKVKYFKRYELCVVPTTAGSGAEVTSNSVIYINNKKFSFESPQLIPDNFFLVPSLIYKLKQTIKSSSGFDAISQAIESLISMKSNKTSVNYAKRSLKLSLKNFINFLKSPNYSNTVNMCLAANLSGKAINISKTTAPHALSYPFTSYFNINHGHAVGLTLNKFLIFNYSKLDYADVGFNLKKRYETLFSLTKTKTISELDYFLSHLKKKANLEDDFKKLNIDIKKNKNKILSGVNELRLKNNPIKLKKSDISNILLS